MSSSAITPLRQRARVDWIDTARGAAIILVVFYHALLAGMQVGEVNASLEFLNSAVFYDIRMPLFFFCSGLLAHWGLSKPARIVMRQRIGVLLWVIFVWTVISITVEQVVPLYPWGSGGYEIHRILWSPFGNLWFIYAVVINTLVVWSLRTLSLPLQIAGVALFALFIEIAVIDRLAPFPQGSFLDSITSYALFCFAGGYWLASGAIRFLASMRRAAWTFVAGVIAWIVLSKVQDAGLHVPRVIASLPALAVGLSAARSLGHFDRMAAPLRSVGGQTLEIFLLHQFFVALGFTLIPLMRIDSGTAATIFIFVTSMAGSLFLRLLILAFDLNILFRPPQISRRAQATRAS